MVGEDVIHWPSTGIRINSLDDYERKFQRAHAEMESAGICEQGEVDPLLRFLKKMGLKPIPNLYWSTAPQYFYVLLCLVVAMSFGRFALQALQRQSIFVPDILGPAVLFAIPMTAFWAFVILRERKKYGLSRWSDL